MSQMNASPNQKCLIKHSLIKSNKTDQSKTKKNLIEVNDEMKYQKNDKNIQEKLDPKLQSKSSKKALLQLKEQVQFEQQVIQALKSEKSAKIMKSSARNTTLKENHNNFESNKRQFSHSKQEDDLLQVSKKKINTQSKKSKVVQNDSKHSKTQEKMLANNELKQQKQTIIIKEPIEKTCQPQKLNKQLIPSQFPQNQKINQQNEKNNVKNEISKASQPNSKDTKMSKNFKRSQISKGDKETDEDFKNFKKSKSSNQSLPKSEARSKDSKIMNKKNGEKKFKPNERWH